MSVLGHKLSNVSLRAKTLNLIQVKKELCNHIAAATSASLIGRSGSSTFRLSTLQCVDVARGLALLFGLGTKALPVWDSKTRWNNLWVDLAVRLTAGSSGRANSPHPSSREGHHSTTQWSSSFLLIID